MAEISRRRFLQLSALSTFMLQLSSLAAQSEADQSSMIYPRTIATLQESFATEMIAYRHYIGYTSKALGEEYPNIAHLFHSFAFSEKIHADNYQRILSALGHEAKPVQIEIHVGDTKSNLQKAARNELRKIQITYPDFLVGLETESCEEAIVYCMYSWKSHRQHEEKIKEIDRFSGMFFGSVRSNIEGMSLDFHICKVCGSTIDKEPHSPCDICNKSRSNYQKIERPT